MDPANVVLIGGGHAHLYLASRAAQYRRAGASLTLVEPGAFWYSGMASGLVSGQYAPETDRVDLQALTHRCGARLVRARAVSIDRGQGLIQLNTGASLAYDLASLNLGSHCAPRPYPLTAADIPVKPIKGLLRLRARVLAEQPPRVAVIGGGATGVELACNLRELVRKNGQETAVHLFARDALPLPGLPDRARRAVGRYLQDIGVIVHTGRTVDGDHEGTLLSEGDSLGQFQLRVIATGLQASTLEVTPALRFDAQRGFSINSHLQTDDPRIYAVGDCSDFSARTLPKIGVFGVRQAPVLHHNLLAALQAQKLKTYRPQQQYLSIVNLGFGRALATRGRFWWLGPAAMQWKEWLDQRFLDQYRV